MSYKVISTIVSLLPIIQPEQQELVLISKLNSFFNFDHNVFILDGTAAEINRFISNNDLKMDCTPKTIFVVDDDATGLDNNSTKISSKDPFVAVVPHTTEFLSNVNLLRRVTNLQQGRRLTMKIGIFFQEFVGQNDLKKLFGWCWERGIITIFAAMHPVDEGTGSLHIFTYNPFGMFRVSNVTGTGSFHDFFLNQNCNFQRYPLRLATSIERMRDRILWAVLLEKINASAVKVNSTSPREIWPQFYYLTSANIEHMYPMQMDSEVIVVPKSLPYSGFTAYLLSMLSTEFFGFSSFTFLAVTAVLTAMRFIKRKKFLLLQTLADIINLLMNDNGSINYQRLARVEVCIIVPLTFAGLIVVNGLLSNLKSYLTRPIFQPEMDSVEEIYRSNLKVFTFAPYWKTKLIEAFQNKSAYRDWPDKIQVISIDELDPQIDKFNSSIIFLWTLDTVRTLVRTQNRLNVRGYHITNTFVNNQNIGYRLNASFPFMERMNDIVSRMKSAGLYQQWLRLGYRKLESDVLTNLAHLSNRSEWDVESFSVPIFIVYGWIGSAVLLIVEIFWKKLKFLWRKLMKRVLPTRIRQLEIIQNFHNPIAH